VSRCLCGKKITTERIEPSDEEMRNVIVNLLGEKARETRPNSSAAITGTREGGIVIGGGRIRLFVIGRKKPEGAVGKS